MLPEVLNAKELEKKYLKGATPLQARPELHISTNNSEYDAEPQVQSGK